MNKLKTWKGWIVKESADDVDVLTIYMDKNNPMIKFYKKQKIKLVPVIIRQQKH